MVSKWTHVSCGSCYSRMNPGREPSKVVDATEEICCFCRKITDEGIFVRADPNSALCKGEHSN